MTLLPPSWEIVNDSVERVLLLTSLSGWSSGPDNHNPSAPCSRASIFDLSPCLALLGPRYLTCPHAWPIAHRRAIKVALLGEKAWIIQRHHLVLEG